MDEGIFGNGLSAQQYVLYVYLAIAMGKKKRYKYGLVFRDYEMC